MMLVGKALEQAVEGTVRGYNRDLLTFDSLDVRLDTTFKYEGSNKTIFMNDKPDLLKHFTSNFDPHHIVLQSKEFILGSTMEYFNMPSNLAAMFTLRSFVAQRGLEQSTSVWLKPNWCGHLVLELVNQLANTAIILKPEMAIGQIHFFECKEE